jgi:hypothetical protein
MRVTRHAIDLIAEARIEAAMEAGEFDDLPGFGEPFEDDLLNYDPNWWIRQKIKRENLNRLFDPQPRLANN